MADDIYEMLSKSGYSEKAIEYFKTRESIGDLPEADQVTDLTGPCGDNMKIQVLGCPGAIASGCAVAALAKGKRLGEAKKIDLDALYKELEKLPDKKIHCARLAVKTLQKALEQYSTKMVEGNNRRMTGGKR